MFTITSAVQLSVRLFITLVCLLTTIVVYSATLPSDSEAQLVGVIINGVEKQGVDAHITTDNNWVAVDDLKRLLGIEISVQEDMLLFTTPIGEAKIDSATLVIHNGIHYLPSSMLKDLLNVTIKFDQPAFALMLTVPWEPGKIRSGVKRIASLKPDINAPTSSLTKIHTETRYEDFYGKSSFENQVDLIGKAGPGSWLMGLHTRESEPTNPNHYFYTAANENNAWRIGTQYDDTITKLRPAEYTGLQWAYDNQGIASYLDFDNTGDYDRFLKDDIVQFDRIIRTDGIPGGIAELRLDDEPIAWARINLDGKYGFINIKRQRSTYNRIQIYFYRHNIGEQPQKVLDFTRGIIDDMLNKGQLFFRAGLGNQGNALDQTTDAENQTEEAIGAVHARFGLTERLSLVASHQYDDSAVDTSVLGARVSLGKYVVAAVDTYHQPFGNANQIRLEGLSERWHMNIDLSEEGQGFDANEQAHYDYQTKAQYRFSPYFNLGFKGRDKESENEQLNYLRPWLNWRIQPKLNLSLYPQTDGEMEASLNFYQSEQTDWLFRYNEDYSRLSFSHKLNDDLSIRLSGELHTEKDQIRQSADAYWNIGSDTNNYLRAGVSHADSNDWRYSLSWDRQFSPGIEVNVSYNRSEDGETIAFDEQDKDYLRVNLRFDLGYDNGRFTGADHQFVNLYRGGISGSVVDQEGRSVDTDHAGILVNGRTLNQTSAGNQFHVRNIPPGVYRVGLDLETLPLEYASDKATYNVEVAANAITQVKFEVETRFGISGRLIGAPEQLEQKISLAVKDDTGKVVASVKTNRFGYYRVDNVPPGEYQVDAVLNNQSLASMPVRIKNKFLFGQNIFLP